MSYFNPIVSAKVTGAAVVAYTAAVFATSTKEQPLVATATSGIANGIFKDNKAVGEHAEFVTYGMTKAKVTSTSVPIVALDFLKPSTDGKLVLAAHGEPCVAQALEPSSTNDENILVMVLGPSIAAYPPGSETDTGASPTTLTVAELKRKNGYHYISDTSGATTLNIPGAASMPPGYRLKITRTDASALTVDAATGTVAGSATHTALDANNDTMILIADTEGDNWYIDHSIIA